MTATVSSSDHAGLLAEGDSSLHQPADPRLKSLTGVLADTTYKIQQGRSAGAMVWPTGFDSLDTALGGGLRSGELVLIGGPQGLGKTTMALQMLRRAVSAGNRSAIFFSFEHDAHAILERLIAIEAAELDGETLSLNTIRSVFEARHTRASSVEQQFANTKGGAKAVRGLERYADRLHIHSSSGMHTGIGEIRAAIEAVTRDTGQAPFVLVDYLQKVPARELGLNEEERITHVVEQLKDIALTYEARCSRSWLPRRPASWPASACGCMTCAVPRPWRTRQTSCSSSTTSTTSWPGTTSCTTSTTRSGSGSGLC